MEDVKSWTELAMSAGPLWVVFGMIIYFLAKYVPLLVAKHVSLINTLCLTQAEIVVALHNLTKEKEPDGQK